MCRSESRLLRRSVEDAPAEVVVAEHAAFRRGEYEVIAAAVGGLNLQRIYQEARDRDGPALVSLRGAEDGLAVDLGHRLGDE